MGICTLFEPQSGAFATFPSKNNKYPTNAQELGGGGGGAGGGHAWN